jgi:EAL domain-containing protein (putative c-di-GMP-specific phosphodiesterase class I)
MGREVILSISVGISIFPDHTEMGSDLLLDASAAMLFAKSSGHNQYRFFDPSMHRQSAERLMMENELRRGIDKGELLLHYQPQVSVATGRIVGMEALVRWRHPGLGLVPPGRFIPVAEQSGLIVPLGEWVMRQACHDLRQLESLGLANVTMAINISAKQFSDSDVVGAIQEAIRASGIEASHLDVEITESTLMHDPANVVGFLDRLKSLGIRLSIDDFGTGFSSLNYLKRFPIDTLKIDQSFITDIAHNTKDEAIAVTIITLAHAMGMTALAEGVESPAQEHILERHGCDVIQGFLYSKPVPLAEIKAMLTSGATLPPGSDGQRDIKFN